MRSLGWALTKHSKRRSGHRYTRGEDHVPEREYSTYKTRTKTTRVYKPTSTLILDLHPLKL